MGDRASLEHTFTSDDVAAFSRVSGDDNPIHLELEAARAARFDDVVVHGMLVSSLLSRLLGTRLPGPGTVLLGQELRYRRPVHPGVPLQANVEVIDIREDKPVVVLRTWIQRGPELVIDGQATVLVPTSRLAGE